MNLKIEDILSKAASSLNNFSETPKLDAEIIMCFVLKISRFELFVKKHEFIDEKDVLFFEQLISRRKIFEPVAYITGEKPFFEDVFKIDKRVLIPRPETEFLVMEAVDHLKKYKKKPAVLDICCGCGCVGLSILRVIECSLTLSDISQNALDVAKINAEKLFPENENIKNIKSDLFENIKGKYDVITANPPYLSEKDMETFIKGSLKYEPRNALFGGKNGFEITQKIIEQSADFLNPDGILAVELGFEGFSKINTVYKLIPHKIVKDYSGIDRIAVFTFKENK